MAAVTTFDDEIGWTQYDGFLTEADVAAVLGDCQTLLRLPEAERLAGDKPASGTQHLVRLDERSELIASVVERAELARLIESILDGTFDQREVAYRSPQPGFGGQKLHADDVPKLDASPARVATAIIALTAFTEKNGATRIVPGSHRRPDLQRHAGTLAHHPDERLLIGAAGTAFVFSGHVLHSGTRNDSATERPALQVVWRSRSVRRTWPTVPAGFARTPPS